MEIQELSLATKNLIKIFYVNAMGPTTKEPQGGIFVSQRIRALHNLGVTVEPINFGIQYSCFARLILKLLGNQTQGDLKDEQIGVHYSCTVTHFNMLDLVHGRLDATSYTKKIYKSILKAFMRTEDINLIHLHWVWPTGLGAMQLGKIKSIPYIVTCHGSDVNISLYNKKLREPMLTVLENAAGVEFVSRALLNRAMEAGYSGKNAHVIYNGIETRIFYNRQIKKEKPVVGFVGNLIPIKGADRLSRIFARIYQNYQGEIEFVVIGKGILTEVLKRDMKMLPVRFTGQLESEKLAQEYSKMSILIVPSRLEGYSCVIKEAQACGVVPVANDVGGIKEAVGDYGVIVSEKNEDKLCEALAEKAISYLNGQIEIDVLKMSEAASRCSWENRQRKSVELYREVLKV